MGFLIILYPCAIAAMLLVRLMWFVLTIPFQLINHSFERRRARRAPVPIARQKVVAAPRTARVRAAPRRVPIAAVAPTWPAWQPSPPPHCPPPGHPAWMYRTSDAPYGPNQAPR